MLVCHLSCEVWREAVGSVEVEDIFPEDEWSRSVAWPAFVAFPNLNAASLRFLVPLEAALDGAQEVRLLALDDVLHPPRVALQLRVRPPHLCHQRRHQPV